MAAAPASVEDGRVHADTTGADPSPAPWPAPTGPPGEGGSAELVDGTRLARAEEGRVVAGVAGGLGAFLQLDPRVLRILFVLATLFGGVGILAYVAAWVVLPSASAPDSAAERVLRRFSGAPTAVQVVVVGLAVLVFGGAAAAGRPGAGWGVVLVTLGFLLLRRDTRAQQRAWAAEGAPPVAHAAPGCPAPPARAAVRAVPEVPAVLSAPAVPAVPAAPAAPAPVVAPGAGTYGSYGVPSLPPARRPTRPPSPLGWLTLGMGLALQVGTAVVDAVGPVDVPALGYLSLALGTVGVGLLIGARAGRARWLVLVGLLLVPPLLVAAVVPVLPPASFQALPQVVAEDLGDLHATPTELDDVQDAYALGFGRMVVDLAKVDLVAEPTRVAVELGVGTVVVVVPDDARVDLTGMVGAGDVAALGDRVTGVGELDLADLDVAAGPEGGGRLALDVRIDGGLLEVRRAGGDGP